MTRYRRKGKSLDFPGKTELVDTIRAQENLAKSGTKKGMCLSGMKQIGRSRGASGASCSSIFHFLSP